MALLCVSILFLVSEVAAIRHAKVDLSKPPLKIRMASKKETKTQDQKVEAPSLKVRAPTKVLAKPPPQTQPAEADAKVLNPAQCFDLSAGAVMNVQSFKEHFGNKSFLLSLAPGSPDPSDEKALTTLYEALLGGCDSDRPPWLVDV